MIYPAYIHHEEGKAYGIEVPDFAGCYAAADTFGDIPAAVQEAAEVYFDGEDFEIPQPSDPENYKDQYAGGQWLFVDIDIDKLNTRKERLNVSFPVYAIKEIDQYIGRVELNRSEFLYQTALNFIRGELVDSSTLVKVKRKAAASPKSKAKRKAAVKRKAPTVHKRRA